MRCLRHTREHLETSPWRCVHCCIFSDLKWPGMKDAFLKRQKIRGLPWRGAHQWRPCLCIVFAPGFPSHNAISQVRYSSGHWSMLQDSGVVGHWFLAFKKDPSPLSYGLGIPYTGKRICFHNCLPQIRGIHIWWSPELRLRINLHTYIAGANANGMQNGSSGSWVRIIISQWSMVMRSFRRDCR